MVATENFDLLTKRQRECMALVAEGLTAKSIARELKISHRTVEQHLAAAIEALGASNRLAAVARFIELQREIPPQDEDGTFMLRAPANLVEAELIETDVTISSEPAENANYWPLLPPFGGRENDAPRDLRKAWIVRLAIAGIMVTCGAILAILAVIELAK